jgi:hypothetical protein
MYNHPAMLFHSIAVVLLTLVATLAPPATPKVEHVTVPDAGIQPQAAVDARGTLHLIYYKGAPSGGDLYYVRRAAGQTAFSPPVRINSEAGSAIAAGAVRGGRLALGRDGWVHVAWNAAHPVERDGAQVTPMWYARLAPGAVRFDAQRAIGTHVKYLDGGGTVAADAAGHVYVVWHAAGPEEGEAHRDMLVATSNDDGATFAPERVFANAGGACGCCGASAMVDRDGRLQILYRGAAEQRHRDATWMTVSRGAAAPIVRLQGWDLPACPMTTFAMSEDASRIVGAWVIEQQIFTADLDPAAHTASAPSPMAGSAVRNHPAIGVNGAGDRLFAWIEGANRSREGNVAWELRNRAGARLAASSAAGATPPLSLIAVVPRADGSFLLIY